MGPNQPEFSIIPKILDGGIAGVIGLSCIFPLDLVKTRLQNQQAVLNGERMYTSMVDCFRKTLKSEGFFGMYNGYAITTLLVTPEKAVKLSANDFFRYHLQTSEGLSMFRQISAGALAGLCATLVTTPMELLKIQMQDAGRVVSSAKLTGEKIPNITITKVIRKLFRTNGVFGLYKGITATALREVFFSMIYFPLFATLNNIKTTDKSRTFSWTFLCGCTSGMTAAWLATPFDVIKTRLQVLTKTKGERTYSGIIDCFIKTLKHEGPSALFKGGATRVMVIAPLFGITQMVYYFMVAEVLLGYQK